MHTWFSEESFIAMIKAQRELEEMLLWGKISTKVPDTRSLLQKIKDFIICLK